MVRYQVILAYDGSAYCGFQRQRRSPTVQAVVEEALQRIGWQGRAVLAAGRTDTGVHAAGQVIAFDLDWHHQPEDLLAALNANLPADVAASSVRAAQSDFHPRYDATARLYRYSIYSQPVRDPFVERYAWRVWPAPQLELLQAGAKLLIGTHDFAAFGHPPRKGGSTVRSVMKAAWEASPQPGEGMTGWVFEIAANGFLNRMVRRLVYLLVCIGQGWHEPGAVSQYLNSPNQALVAGQAPPQGLTLVEVLYV